MSDKSLIIIGGGPAGMAAALSAKENGIEDITIIERDNQLGGVLNQCIHNGFGLTRFKENLTGPEYANKFITKIKENNIKVLTGTFVIDIDDNKNVKVMNENGIHTLKAKAVIFAMGCRERSKGALNIPGTRPSGIYSAGTAQKYINIKGYMPGKKVVILGSGDIGLIMARRMTLEGSKVLAVVEIMEHSSGLKRNIEQCLNDFNIPLLLSHTIIDIKGKDRVEGVTVAKVDENKKPINGTEIYYDCDTILFSVGLIPENELTKKVGIDLSSDTKGAIVNQYRQTEKEGFFACGNVLQVHDLVDYVSEEAEIAGKYSAEYIKNSLIKEESKIDMLKGENVGYVLPQKISLPTENVKIFFRVKKAIKNVKINLVSDNKILFTKNKVSVAPGEMETMILSKEILKNNYKSIIVEVLPL